MFQKTPEKAYSHRLNDPLEDMIPSAFIVIPNAYNVTSIAQKMSEFGVIMHADADRPGEATHEEISPKGNIVTVVGTLYHLMGPEDGLQKARMYISNELKIPGFSI